MPASAMEPTAAEQPCGLLWDVLSEFPLEQAFRFAPPERRAPAPAAPRAPELGAGPRAAAGPAGGQRCQLCRLPLGGLRYAGEGGALHGECKAQLVLQRARAEEAARQERDARLKERHRAEYGIGWRPERIPGAAAGAARPGRGAPWGPCCLVLEEGSGAVALAPAPHAAAAVNPEYLAIALRVRREEGREPFFSLDPKKDALSLSEGRDVRWQAKRFEPAWLEGTSAGEVLFQADYHLKELSMGEREQPVVGMRSCLDLSEAEGAPPSGWSAREWFVVRGAELRLAEGGALVPLVEMGVEAREMVCGPGGLEDAPLTRPEHPLVRYAAEFTRHFDLIAERRSVVYHLRELAKASVLAKFVLESGAELDESRLGPAGGAGAAGAARGPAVVPQLWNERSRSQVCVKDGEILDAGMLSGTSVHGVYGGVQLSLQEYNVSKKTLQPFTFAASWYPRGVDLNLDTFNLSAPSAAVRGEPCGRLPSADEFWSSIDCGPEPQLQDDRSRLLSKVFNPHLADRREEGEKFTPPAAGPSYAQRLRESLREEEEAQQRRRCCFFGEGFDAERPGPLFPASWTPQSSFDTLRTPAPRGAAAPPQGALRARPDLQAEALCLLWQGAAPAFDRRAEDGARFRVYRAGGLELRTVQEHRGAERLGAVFSAAAPPAAPGSAVCGEGAALAAAIVGAVQYVEARGDAAQAEPEAHFYVVLETSRGDAVVSERPAGGSAAWAVNPANLEARNALAKVTSSTRCRGAGVSPRDVQRLAAALPANSSSQAYAAGVYGCVPAGVHETSQAPQKQQEPLSASPLSCEDPDDYSDLNYVI